MNMALSEAVHSAMHSAGVVEVLAKVLHHNIDPASSYFALATVAGICSESRGRPSDLKGLQLLEGEFDLAHGMM